MADRVQKDTIQLKCSESIIACQICMEVFDSPRILPCQHNFCRECVISLVQKHCLHIDGRANGDPFPCPVCRKECKIRQKGRLCIEEHLKGFPEHLLLKSLLESVVDSEEGNEKVETERYDACTFHEEKKYDGLFLSADDESHLRNFFTKYIYFLSTIQYFISILNYNQPFMGRWSLNRLRRSELTDLVYEICTIPAGSYNIFRFLSLPSFDDVDLPSVLGYIELSETTISEQLSWGWYNEPSDSFGVRDAQTQTENMSNFSCYSKALSLFESLYEFIFILINRLGSSTTKVPDINEFRHGTVAIILNSVLRGLFMVIYFWYWFEYTAVSLLNLYGVSFVITSLYIFIYERCGLRCNVFFLTAVITEHSLSFAINICSIHAVYYALKRIVTLFDFWFLCKFIFTEIMLKIVIAFLKRLPVFRA